MRICIVASSGVSLINFRGCLIKKLVQRGYEVICISIEPKEEMQEAIERLGASYFQVEGSRTGIGVLSGLKMIKAYKRAFQQFKPDMCYLYMSKPIAFGGWAACKVKIPHINILVNGLENAYYRRGIKDWLVRCVMNFFYRKVGRKADNVFMQNHDDYQYFVSHKICSKDKMCVVGGSGVDMEHFMRKPLPPKPVVLMVARLLYSKGIREYLGAISIVKAQNSNVKFMLVGGCDNNDEAISKKQLEKYIRDYDIEYCGYAKDVRPFIGQASIFVLPSYHEGLPRSILEALSMGRPIITTDAPGCKETVIDGKNGFIVPVGNTELLAEKVLELASDSSMRERMAEESYILCKEIFEVNKVNEFIIKKLERSN